MPNDLLTFNVAKGNMKEFTRQVKLAGSQKFYMVAVKLSGLETDETLADYDTLAAILAGTTDECDFTGYSRQALTTVADRVDDTTGNNYYAVDAADVVWDPAGGVTNNDMGALIICFDPDGTANASTMVPCTKHPWLQTTSGSRIQVTVTDFYRAL